MIGFPCNCGHKEIEHYVKDGYTHYGPICWQGGEDYNGYIVGACNCFKYIKDNLRYLENLVE